MTGYFYTAAGIREIEKLAETAYRILPETLMQRAGEAAFRRLRARWPKAKSIIVFCGSGNNGGDGYVLAYAAHQEKMQVKIRHIGNLQGLSDLTFKMMQKCRNEEMDIRQFSASEVLEGDVCVDAVLGVGLKGKVRSEIQKVICKINMLDLPVLSIDVPSGVNADTGDAAECSVSADCTLTFLGLKRGLLTGRALNYIGELFLEKLGLPEELFAQISPAGQCADYEIVKPFVSSLRLKSSYKQKFGHVLVAGGDIGMGGAAYLAALGAARVGAGLVTLATRPEHALGMLLKQPEIMTVPIRKKRDLAPFFEKASVIVLGMGLGFKKWGKALYRAALSTDLPMVIDADALKLLAENPVKRSNWILTPHSGEAARLLNLQASNVENRRFEAAQSIQKKYGGICVLKGAGTIMQSEKSAMVCRGGNPGMASAGMGDLLSGMIGGLIAQNFSFKEAAVLGVCVHAQAGDFEVKQNGQRGMLATDLLLQIRKLVNWREV